MRGGDCPIEHTKIRSHKNVNKGNLF